MKITKECINEDGTPLSKEQFINKIKTNNEFAKKWGELGPIYGKQWRKWARRTTREEKIVNPGVYTEQIDQIQNLINDLKTNPDSRRLMVNAWDVGSLDQMVLPPCHYGFQVYTRELSYSERYRIADEKGYLKYRETNGIISNLYLKDENKESNIKDWDNKNIPTRAISLMWNQRSVDTFLGLPFNIASYGLLLEIIAREVNMVPDELIGNLGDVHLYSNHIEQAKEQIGRELTWEEKIQWVMKNTDVEMENLYITEAAAALEGTTRWPYSLPTLKVSWYIDNWNTPEAKEVRKNEFDAYIRQMRTSDFILENYKSHPAIKAPLSN
jgi:thymidylate synthase